MRGKRLAHYEENHPPISDEEFLRRCSPGVRREVALEVRKIISEIYGMDYGRIYPESNLIELEGG